MLRRKYKINQINWGLNRGWNLTHFYKQTIIEHLSQSCFTYRQIPSIFNLHIFGRQTLPYLIFNRQTLQECLKTTILNLSIDNYNLPILIIYIKKYNLFPIWFEFSQVVVEIDMLRGSGWVVTQLTSLFIWHDL